MKHKLELIVFTTGACVMILELVGSRVLAPYLGTSIVVWTSLIGIILGCLSVGYWFGGRLADQEPNWRMFAAIIFLSAVSIGLVGLFKNLVLSMIQELTADIRIGSFLATLILFGPASILLGMVSPYAVRLKLQAVNTSGATVGQLYAISTVGSIVGTFLAGFFLIAFVGHTRILFLLALILGLTSLLAAPKDIIRLRSLALFLAAAGWLLSPTIDALAYGKETVAFDTSYQHIRIEEMSDHKTGRSIRALRTDPFVVQSAVFTDGDEDLVFDYTKFYRLVDHFRPEPMTALLIGGAAYTYPRDFVQRHSEAAIDVVEIDPMMTATAKTYFGLTDDPRIRSYHEDARTFLNRTTARYDALFVDAYHNMFSVPYQLTTKEAVERMAEILTDGGVLMANLISALEGPKARFLESEVATYRSVFPQVYLFQASPDRSPAAVQNIILVALKSETPVSFISDNPELAAYLGRYWQKDLQTGPILTDDFAPVDQYVLKYLER